MSELTDYQRMVEKPNRERLDRMIQNQASRIGLLTAALNSSPCPRPVNTAPHGLTVEECIKRGECGCDNAAALTGKP